MFPVRKVPVRKDLKVKIVHDWKLRNLSTEAVAEINLLTIQQVKDYLFEFNQILNKTKKTRKFENLWRWKINQDHVACLQEFVNRKQITGFTLWGARNHLLSAFPSLRSLSLTTVSKILRKEIGMTYKKLGELNPKKIIPEYINNLSLWLQTILGLYQLWCYVIFADEISHQ